MAGRKAKSRSRGVEIYTVKSAPEKKAFDGFIKKHPWYVILGATISGVIMGFFFRKKLR